MILAMAAPAPAQTVTDRMLCEWILPCVVDGSCADEGDHPLFTLERVGDTWLWDPRAMWDGFPVSVVENLAEAEALIADEGIDLGLLLVPNGRTADGALILDGYGFSYFPEQALSNRPMVHRCTPASDIAS